MITLTWTEFRKLTAADIKDGQCIKVMANEQMAFYVVVHPEEVMKDRIEANCDLIDKSRGF